MANPQPNTTISFEEKTAELESQMNRLKVLYEQYFLGHEKIPPTHLRRDVEKLLQFLLANLSTIKNTALRFKINGLQSRFISWLRIWDRNLQQIEEGTYAPHRFKLKIKERSKDKTAPTSKEKPAAAAPEGKRNTNIEALLKQYLGAKQKCNESVTGINYENFAKTITKQSTELKKRYQCKSVKYKVVIEGGKTKLKVTPV